LTQPNKPWLTRTLADRERGGVAGPGPGENFKCREFFFGEPTSEPSPQGKMKPEASCIHYNKIWVEWTSIAFMVFGVTVPAFIGNEGTTQSLSGSEKLSWMVMAMAGGLCIIAQTSVNFVIKEDIEYGLEKFVDSLDSEDRKQQALRTEVLSGHYIDSLKMLSNVESALFGIAPSLLGAMAWVYVDEDSQVALVAGVAGSLFKMPVVLSGSICGIGFFGNMALAAGPFGMKNTTVMLLLGNVVTAVIVQGAMAGLLELYNSFEWVSTLIVAAAVAFYFSPVWYRSSDGNAHSILDKSQAVDHLSGTGGINGPSVVINFTGEMCEEDREKASLLGRT
jgi:hypothetical protein